MPIPAGGSSSTRDVELKVDAGAEWGRADFERLAGFGVVRVVDIKGHYGSDYPQGERDEAGLVAMAAEILPDAIIEDPVDRAERAPRDRLRRRADLVRRPGSLGRRSRRPAADQASEREAVPVRHGGEAVRVPRPLPPRGDRDVRRRPVRLGVGRAQIQALASLFYPGGPNDCAPAGYNAPEPAAGLPVSPLPESAWRGMTAF